MKHGLGESTLRWTEKKTEVLGTEGCHQWHEIQLEFSQHCLHQESILGTIHLSIFINDMDGGAEWTRSKFANDTELGGVVVIADRCAIIQRYLSRLDEWSNRNIIKFLRLGRNNPMHLYRLGAKGWKAALRRVIWGSWSTTS